MKPDVLIIGAGPVGLTLAAELARYGLRVRLIDQAEKPTDKSKALVLWSRTLELLDRMGCTTDFLAAGMKAHAASITAGDKQLAHVTFDHVQSPYPFALMLPQSDTERLLTQHLLTLGVQVERSTQLLTFTPSADTVTATLRHADGREEQVDTPWLLGCDGAHSTIRHTLGIPFEGSTEQSDWMLADAHLTGVPHPDQVQIMWHADGVLALFPIDGTRFRVIADLGLAKSEAPRTAPTLAEVQTILDQRGPGHIIATDPIWLAAFRINERKVKEYRHGRVFLLGDAAHIHSPAGGQGMNTGMQDAINLAWKLALVHHGAPQTLLHTYSPERSAVGDQVLANASRLTTMATLRGGVKQSIRNHIAGLVFGLASVRRQIADTMSEVTIGYPDSPLSQAGPGFHGLLQPGQRVPLGPTESPIGTTPRFALFATPGFEADALIARYPHLLEPTPRLPLEPEALWLVRPDGYLALAARAGDWTSAETYLDKLLPE